MSWPAEQKKLKRELCDLLMRIGALKFGMFSLPDNKLSPYYVDLRIIPSFPEAFAKVEHLFHQMAVNSVDLKEIKRIAAIPTAGIPFASVLAYNLTKPFLYVRGEPTHGRTRRVEGILISGDSVLLVDDLITTGKTMLGALDSIRAEGGVVKDILVLIDRQEGGKEALMAQGVKLHSLIRMDEAARILYDVDSIDKEQLNSILKQISARG